MSCLHDNAYRARRVEDSEQATTSVWCSDCDTLLYERSLNLTTMQTKRVFYDETYEQLYTRHGRLMLLAALMRDKGMAVPAIWNPAGDQ